MAIRYFSARPSTGYLSRGARTMALYAMAVSAGSSLSGETIAAPAKPHFSGRVVTAHRSGSLLKMTLVAVTGGKPTSKAPIGLMEGAHETWVAPTGKYIIWVGEGRQGETWTIRVSAAAPTTARPATGYRTVHFVAPEDRLRADLVAWSPHSDTALFVGAPGG